MPHVLNQITFHVRLVHLAYFEIIQITHALVKMVSLIMVSNLIYVLLVIILALHVRHQLIFLANHARLSHSERISITLALVKMDILITAHKLYVQVLDI